MASPILRLPLELQYEVVAYITNAEDLRSLCLVSKSIATISTPRLYHDLFLSSPPKLLLKRIKYLSQGQNLKYVRTLTTGIFSRGPARAMDNLLPKLRDDYLIRFNFDRTSYFPNRDQMKFLWSRQRNIRNLKFTHIFRDLVDFNGDQNSRSNLSNSITQLDLIDRPYASYWTANEVDLSCVRKLRIRDSEVRREIRTRTPLFPDQLLLRLTHLCIANGRTGARVELKNYPSLKHLALFEERQFARKWYLAIPSEWPLISLQFMNSDFKDLEHVLTRTRGLRFLVVQNTSYYRGAGQSVQEMLEVAIERHRESLDLLSLNDRYSTLDSCLFKCLKTFDRISRLALRFRQENVLGDCKMLIESLPCLVALAIYDHLNSYYTLHKASYQDVVTRFANALMQEISASSKFVLLCLCSGFHAAPSIDENSECFVRRGWQHLFGGRIVFGGEMAIRIRPDDADGFFYESESMKEWLMGNYLAFARPGRGMHVRQ